MSSAEKELYYWYVDGNATNFSAILYDLISKADNNNLQKLSLLYPEEVEAMKNFSYTEGYWEDLQNRMRNGSQ